MTISRKLISSKASSQVNIASNTRTGTSARAQWPASTSSPLTASHDLQRSEPLGLPIVAVLPAGGCANRKGHRQPQHDREIQVELGADVVIMVPLALLVLRRHGASEDSRANVA